MDDLSEPAGRRYGSSPRRRNVPAIVAAASAAAAIRPDAAQIFAFLFLMLGPVKVIGPFVKMTPGLDVRSLRRLAFKAFLISTASLIFAAIAGAGTMVSSTYLSACSGWQEV